MAANLNGEKDGKAAMMYVGDEPWHGLGTKLESAATSEQAIEAARLDWKVSKEQVKFMPKGGFELGHMKEVPGQFAVVRGDTQTPLGIVGGRYTPLQNKEAFSFFDAIVGMKEAIYHTAGALGEGERVWMLAKLPGIVRVVGDDIVEKFLLLVNTHDGSGSVKVLFTPIRVVCQNTLNQAISERGNTFRMRHTPNMGLRVEEAQEALGIVSAKFGIFEDMARKLAATELTVKASKNYFIKVAQKVQPEDAEAVSKKVELPAKTQAIVDKLSELFEVGRGQDLKGARGTAWGAYNAVTEFVDYHRGTTGIGTQAIRMNRAGAALFGTGAAMKARAWEEATALTR